MAVYDDPANGLHPADGNGAPGAEAETDAAAVASVADSDSCGSDAEELEDREAAAATPAHVLFQHFQPACLDPAVFELKNSSDNDEESASAIAPAANVDSD